MKSLSREAKSGLVAGVALLGVYTATMAPGVTYWDAGEFLAAVHSLGVPHPPGTPLYIIVASVWAKVLGPAVGFARSVNLFSAVCAAAGCALLANLFARWTRDSHAGFAAAVCAGATSSIWLSATETEVYAPAFLVAMLLVWIANEVLETDDARYLILLGYVTGLGWALHLTALIVIPGVLVLAAPVLLRREGFGKRAVLTIAAGILGASVVLFMYVRARLDPAINQGNPATVTGILDVIARAQYGHVSFFKRQAPLYLQFGNLFEWADWQFALGLNKQQPPNMARTPVTIVFALLGAYGFLKHRLLDRHSWRAMAAIFATASIGVTLYLNLKAGPSYGVGFVGAGAIHEARERDYFFILAWVFWGAWAGMGAVTAARRLVSSGRAIPGALLVAALPVILNWRAVDRSMEPAASEATEFAREILRLAPGRAVVFANSDNETYPVWYMREVKGERPEIVSVTLPLLGAKWYREEVARRHGLLDSATVMEWRGTEATVRVICERAARQERPVVGPYNRQSRLLPPGCLKFRNEHL